MRLLLANPNTTAAITARMGVAARGVASAGTEVVEATASFGAAVIGSRGEMAIAEHAALSVLAGGIGGCDGAIVGASLDSGVRGARALLGRPVVGITEAALHVACLVGGRFGVITTSAHGAVVTREMVEGYGLGGRLAGMRWLSVASTAVLEDPAGFAGAMVPLARSLVEDDLAESVVLIGAVMAGVPGLMQGGVGVPVLEGVTCAVGLVEGLVRLGLPGAAVGTYAKAGGRRVVGVDGGLAGFFGG